MRFGLRRVAAIGSLGVAAGLLGACAQYQARPIPLDRYPVAAAGVRLNPAPVAGVWRQADLLTFALAHNAQVFEAAAKYRTALAAARVARQASPATLTLTAEYAKEAGTSSPWLYGLGSDIPLTYGARRSAQLATADLTALQALYDYGETVWAVRTAMARAVAETQAAARELPLARQAAALRQDRFDRLSRRVAAGEDARSISLVAQGELLTAQRRFTEANARQVQARAALSKALGLPLEAVADLKLSPPMAGPPADLAAWRGEAALSRRDVLRAVADYDLAEAALRLQIARQFPAISIGPGYTWERGVTKLPFNLGLTLPPYDLNKAGIAQAEARRAEAGASLEAAQANVLASVDQAQAALMSARQIKAQIESRDLPLARRMQATARRSTEAGEGDRTEELGASAAAAETELVLLDADRTAALAAVDLEDALRRPFDPAETEILKSKTAVAGAPQ